MQHSNSLFISSCIRLVTVGLFIGAGFLQQASAQTSKGERLNKEQLLRKNECLTSPSGRYKLVLQDDGNVGLMDNGVGKWYSDTHNQNVDALKFQNDGNLVIYKQGGIATWASNSTEWGADFLLLQDDGNLVIYAINGDGSETAVWALKGGNGQYVSHGNSGWVTGNNPRKFQENSKGKGNELIAIPNPAAERCGTYESSDNPGAPAINCQSAFLNKGEYLISNNKKYVLVFQQDANLVLYRNRDLKVLWASGTNGSGAGEFVVLCNGNLAIGNNWSSGTEGKGYGYNLGGLGSTVTALYKVRVLLREDGNVLMETKKMYSIDSYYKFISCPPGAACIERQVGCSVWNNVEGNGDFSGPLPFRPYWETNTKQ